MHEDLPGIPPLSLAGSETGVEYNMAQVEEAKAASLTFAEARQIQGAVPTHRPQTRFWPQHLYRAIPTHP